jgi:hypothetical protein
MKIAAYKNSHVQGNLSSLSRNTYACTSPYMQPRMQQSPCSAPLEKTKMKRRTFTEAVHDGAERPGGGVEELVDVLEEEHVGVQVDELVVVLKLQATAASHVLLRSAALPLERLIPAAHQKDDLTEKLSKP